LDHPKINIWKNWLIACPGVFKLYSIRKEDGQNFEISLKITPEISFWCFLCFALNHVLFFAHPEIIAAQEEETFNEINETFDLSTLNEQDAISIIMNVDIPPPFPPPMAFTLSLSEETIKNMLLKYSNAAISSNIQDPVLLALSRGIRDHL
jgi:hypothetical protein